MGDRRRPSALTQRTVGTTAINLIGGTFSVTVDKSVNCRFRGLQKLFQLCVLSRARSRGDVSMITTERGSLADQLKLNLAKHCTSRTSPPPRSCTQGTMCRDGMMTTPRYPSMNLKVVSISVSILTWFQRSVKAAFRVSDALPHASCLNNAPSSGL